jgi:CubicO group peptidase (beta-lactamase class C family)
VIRAPTRRAVLTGLAATAVASRAGAQPAPLGGSVGVIAGSSGLAGMVFEGEGGVRLGPDQAWHIGSNTKAMTAALYARLVEQGRCRWGATLPQLFPALTVHAGWHGATVEEMMAHTAGLTDAAIDSAWLRAHHADTRALPVQRRAFAERMLSAPPSGQRGTFAYGNANYILLGAAIETATGAMWEDVMRAELFRPLGMRGAGFGAPPGRLWGRRERNAKPADPAGIADNPAALGPAGRVHLTPGDYAAFLGVFLHTLSPWLARATVERLLTPPRPDLAYAGGWGLAGSVGRRGDVLTHDGSNTLWYATARVDRGSGRAVAAITNRGDAGGRAAVHGLAARLNGQTAP